MLLKFAKNILISETRAYYCGQNSFDRNLSYRSIFWNGLKNLNLPCSFCPEGNTSNGNFQDIILKRTKWIEKNDLCEYLEIWEDAFKLHAIIISKVIEKCPKSFKKFQLYSLMKSTQITRMELNCYGILCRLIGLECVLASTNAMINNL